MQNSQNTTISKNVSWQECYLWAGTLHKTKPYWVWAASCAFLSGIAPWSTFRLYVGWWKGKIESISNMISTSRGTFCRVASSLPRHSIVDISSGYAHRIFSLMCSWSLGTRATASWNFACSVVQTGAPGEWITCIITTRKFTTVIIGMNTRQVFKHTKLNISLFASGNWTLI